MRNPFSARLRIGLSRTHVCLIDAGALWRPKESILSYVDSPPAGFPSAHEAGAQLNAALQKADCEGQSAGVIVGDEWVRYFMTTPPLQATRLDDCRAAAAMRFQSLYGEAANGWTLEADWNAGKPFLTCAIPSELLDILSDTAKQFRLRLVQITPQFVAAWNCRRSRTDQSAWLGTVNGRHLTLGVVAGARLHGVIAGAFPEDAADRANWLDEHIGRESLRLGFPPPSRVQLYGNVPSRWTHSETVTTCSEAAGDKNTPAGIALARTGIQT